MSTDGCLVKTDLKMGSSFNYLSTGCIGFGVGERTAYYLF